jgi:streptomycin 6-kinase
MLAAARPEPVRQRAVSQGSQAWLDDLDERVGRLCRDWGLRPIRLLDGGTAALVLQVVDADGRPGALKMSLPRLGFADQLRLLARADGRGYVRLHRADPDAEVALLELLGPSLAGNAGFRAGAGLPGGLPPEEQISVLCELLAVAWQVPVQPEDRQSWDNAEELAALISRLWNELDRPVPERVVEQALEYTRRRTSTDREHWVLVHGDPHPGNALKVRAHRSGAVRGWVFVDPAGFTADPAYDVGVMLRDWSEVLRGPNPVGTLRRFCRLAAARTGLSEQAIWEWAYVERVSSGLFVTAMGEPDHGRRFLQTAELLLG